MSKDRDIEIEFHMYGARLLLDNLWAHMEQEFATPEDIKEVLTHMLDDITEYYSNHVCEQCQAEEPTLKAVENEPTEDEIAKVLPFRKKGPKDWTEN